MPESLNGTLKYDSYAVVEVLEEGQKVIGWDKRNPVPGSSPGRFKRGFGVALNQHHAGRVGYHEGEIGFERVTRRGGTQGGGGAGRFAGGNANPAAAGGGGTGGGPADVHHSLVDLKVDAATLTIRDGVISSKNNPAAKITLAALAKSNGGQIRSEGACVHPGSIGRSMNRGVGCCFAEVEVDTYTGNWHFLRAAYCHDSGNIINPLLGDGDMHGSLVQSFGLATDAVPWDREFPGTAHYAVGFLSYRLPTIMDGPDQTNVFVNSLEPRCFFGTKGFAETAIGAPPGALANAIYNACGVRIREHPITRDKIMAGPKAVKTRGGETASKPHPPTSQSTPRRPSRTRPCTGPGPACMPAAPTSWSGPRNVSSRRPPV